MSAIYGNADFQNAVLTVLACVVLAVLVWCIYTFIRAIFFFIFSGTKEENKKKWWNSIRFMIIGVVLTILLLFFVPTVLRRMNVPEYNVYSPRNIFNRAWTVITSVFKLGDVVKKSQENNQYNGNMYFDTTPEVQQPSSAGYQL